MTDPWHGQRHRSWASNTTLMAAMTLILLATTIIVDATNGTADPPTYLTGLLGAAGGALFGAAGSDKSKREAEIARDAQIAKRRMIDVNETAIRAEARADQTAEVVSRARPDLEADLVKPPDLPPHEGADS